MDEPQYHNTEKAMKRTVTALTAPITLLFFGLTLAVPYPAYSLTGTIEPIKEENVQQYKGISIGDLFAQESLDILVVEQETSENSFIEIELSNIGYGRQLVVREYKVESLDVSLKREKRYGKTFSTFERVQLEFFFHEIFVGYSGGDKIVRSLYVSVIIPTRYLNGKNKDVFRKALLGEDGERNVVLIDGIIGRYDVTGFTRGLSQKRARTVVLSKLYMVEIYLKPTSINGIPLE